MISMHNTRVAFTPDCESPYLLPPASQEVGGRYVFYLQLLHNCPAILLGSAQEGVDAAHRNATNKILAK